MKAFVVSFLVGVAMVQLLLAKPGDATVSCGQVESQIAPCLTYLQGGGTPPANCCTGVRTLSQSLTSKQDRQAACECLKSAAGRYPSLKPDAASALPNKCGVTIGVPISSTVNCANIQ